MVIARGGPQHRDRKENNEKTCCRPGGRPNVGKSTLFNCLAENRWQLWMIFPAPRDRLLSEGEWSGIPFFLIVDTGGIDPSEGGRTPLSVGSAGY